MSGCGPNNSGHNTTTNGAASTLNMLNQRLKQTRVKTNRRTLDVSVTSCKSLCEADHMQTRAAVVRPTRRELQSSRHSAYCSTPVPVYVFVAEV